ncbi:hypothetical protein BJ138DRAFT_131512 [Hygrophoropsis aurantiaca]|uniref:Uncharacterized protein n=1 Tax=Hygrophoropsis aurantiaca TaxID=72124 RepID=A0ACB7ZRS7_9AGAM|nr:hypothetical protein BJ138DRAFT_131512 [Hygrophoropsis aurantiaca]
MKSRHSFKQRRLVSKLNVIPICFFSITQVDAIRFRKEPHTFRCHHRASIIPTIRFYCLLLRSNVMTSNCRPPSGCWRNGFSRCQAYYLTGCVVVPKSYSAAHSVISQTSASNDICYAETTSISM